MPGIEPGAFHMQSERATTALHPLMFLISMIYQNLVQPRRASGILNKGLLQAKQMLYVLLVL